MESQFDLIIFKEKIQEIFRISNYTDNLFIHYFIKDGLYRARLNKDGKLFQETKDFWYPNWSTIERKYWSPDRFNKAGDSLWYLTNKLDACIAETRPEKGAIISVANIKQRLYPRVFTLLYLDKPTLMNSDSTISNALKIAEKKNSNRFNTETLKIKEPVEKLMNEITTLTVDSSKKFKYNISIAVKELFEGAGYDGMFYPSIAYGNEGINCVLFPKAVKSNFYIDQTILFGVIDAQKDCFYKVAPILVGKSLSPNKDVCAQIKWQYPNDEEVKAYSKRIDIRKKC